jgi:hypothetical protein
MLWVLEVIAMSFLAGVLAAYISGWIAWLVRRKQGH